MLDLPPVYGARNPFPFMELQDVQELKNSLSAACRHTKSLCRRCAFRSCILIRARHSPARKSACLEIVFPDHCNHLGTLSWPGNGVDGTKLRFLRPAVTLAAPWLRRDRIA